MINLKILIPEGTTNYVKNPAFRYGTTGWTTFGATLTRTMDYARFNIASGKVVTNGSAINEGVYYRTTELQGISGVVTVSCYVYGSGGKVRIRLRDGSGNQFFSDPFPLDQRWARVEVTGTVTGTNDVRLYVELAESTAKVVTYYVDGAQIERKAYSTTFCDGDQPHCSWEGKFSASKSTRRGDTRLGGRWVPLAGPCRDDDSIYITKIDGFGMNPLTNITQEWSQDVGGFYQSTKINSRPVTLEFFIKNEAQRREANPDTTPLHALRQQLINLFKPDVTVGGESFLFEYSEVNGDRPLYLWLRYEAGLTGSWDVRNAFVNSMPVRMIAVDPAFYEDNQEVLQLAVKGYYSNSTYKPLWKKGLDGKWTAPIANTSSTQFYKIVRGSDGTYYIAASDLKVYTWDGTSLIQIGTTNNTVNVMEFGMDGMLYLGGPFTSVNGVAMNYLAKYDPNTATWSTLSTGANASVTALCYAPNGQLYIGGGFSTLGGVTCRYIGRWDGSQFRTVGATSGVDDVARSIQRGIDKNTLLVAGDFDTSYGGSVTYNKVCTIDITTNLLSPLGDGFTADSVDSIVQNIDGLIYASATINSGGDGAVFEYSGGVWTNILTLDIPARKVRAGPDGTIYVCGPFAQTTAGYFPNIARYIRGSWSGFEVYFNTTTVWDVIITPEGEIIVITSANQTGAYSPGYNTITNNGTMGVFPLMYFKGPCTIRYIENLRTRQAIYLDLQIFSNEEVTLDFALGKITSTIRGNLLYSLLPGSEIRGIYLLPGENEVAVLVNNEVSPLCQLRWTPQHWSADAIENVSAP